MGAATLNKMVFVLHKEKIMKDTFVVYTSYLEKFSRLSDEQMGILFRAMMEYQALGEIPSLDDITVSVCFDIVKCDMDANNAKYDAIVKRNQENGKRGGRPRTEPNPSEPKEPTGFFGNPRKPKKADNDNEYEYEYEYEYDNDNDSDLKREDTIVSKREVRHRFGQYNNVLLSDSDLEKLEKEFPDDWKERIERLSEYIESKGVKYKNHLATIRAWARKNAPKKTEYDWGELDERSLG